MLGKVPYKYCVTVMTRKWNYLDNYLSDKKIPSSYQMLLSMLLMHSPTAGSGKGVKDRLLQPCIRQVGSEARGAAPAGG